MPKGLDSSRLPTKPSRAELRRDAERIQQEKQSADDGGEPPVTPLHPRNRDAKVRFNTYLPSRTYQRVLWLSNDGDYTITAITEAAMTEFLDKMSVPDNPSAP